MRCFCFIFLLLFAFVIEAQNGLVAYYPLNGNAEDLGLHSHDGFSVGASVIVDRFGNPSGAMSFDGVDDYIEIPDADHLSISTTGELTISVWLRPNRLDFLADEGNGYIHWMGKGQAGQHEYVCRMYNYNSDRPNRISGYVFNLTGGLGSGSYVQEAVVTGDWMHIVVAYDYPNNAIRLYKDGVLKDTDFFTDYNVVPRNGTAPLRLGTRDFNSFLAGAIDDLRVFNRVLTPTEIEGLFEEERACSVDMFSYQDLGPHSTTYVVDFELTPAGNGFYDGVIGLSGHSTVDSYSDMACLVQLQNGEIKARNGDVYDADTVIGYTIGETYRVRVQVDESQEIYTVWIEELGEWVRLALDYSFRADYVGSSSLLAWSHITSDLGCLQVEDFVIQDTTLTSNWSKDQSSERACATYLSKSEKLNESNGFDFQLYDLNARLISSSSNFDLSELPSGGYILHLVTSDKVCSGLYVVD